jgi:ketosteroid isomerase-like protein
MSKKQDFIIAVHSFFDLLREGKTIEAIQNYYADNVETRENTAQPVVGKQKHLEMEQRNLKGVNTLQINILTLVIDEVKQIVMGEMDIHFESLKGETMHLEEAFVQHWQHQKITSMRFYYKEIKKD